MSKELTAHTSEMVAYNADHLENFYTLLNRQPPADAVNVNKLAGNSKYLPITFLEMKLDELYFGLWKSETIDTKVVGNEYVVTVQVAVYHPIVKKWITRTGIGSVAIQQKKGAAITDLDSKYINALQKNAPAAKAFAFKNAVKSFGTIFGRDLNRNEDDVPEYVPGTTQAAIEENKQTLVKQAIAGANTKARLKEIYTGNRSMPGITDWIADRRKELENEAA